MFSLDMVLYRTFATEVRYMQRRCDPQVALDTPPSALLQRTYFTVYACADAVTQCETLFCACAIIRSKRTQLSDSSRILKTRQCAACLIHKFTETIMRRSRNSERLAKQCHNPPVWQSVTDLRWHFLYEKAPTNNNITQESTAIVTKCQEWSKKRKENAKI